MKFTTRPSTWKAPDSHPDFGDPRPEIEHLRFFAVTLLETFPDTTIVLEIPEPGLMFCRIESKSGSTAEVYSIRLPLYRPYAATEYLPHPTPLRRARNTLIPQCWL